jgi:hypothetical protein
MQQGLGFNSKGNWIPALYIVPGYRHSTSQSTNIFFILFLINENTNFVNQAFTLYLTKNQEFVAIEKSINLRWNEYIYNLFLVSLSTLV